MKEAIIHAGPEVEIIDSEVPKPQAHQVVIKVVFSGSNPKDWKYPEWRGINLNQGDDIAGTVHAVGDKVTEFKEGDRVAAFHEMLAPHGSYAEYAVAWDHTTFHIPAETSFEEAATIPLAGMTAALGLYKHLALPQPWTPAVEPTPLIVYGAASAVGAFVIKLAAQSNIHPLLCVAGRGADFVRSIPGFDAAKGDTVVDYRRGDDAVVEALRKASEGRQVAHAYDAVSEKSSTSNIAKVLTTDGVVTRVLPPQDDDGSVPASIEQILTSVGLVHKDSRDGKDFGSAYFRHFARGLSTGDFTGHPYEVRPGGLGGVQAALKDLKEGKASAVKYIFCIADTDGVTA
ncbi:hypothetical protein HKX48_000569 [Thoreauomyces humboldtii]|nr:hypothetical protein HKX48_000569 [Thoreauomyces humboldtii]